MGVPATLQPLLRLGPLKLFNLCFHTIEVKATLHQKPVQLFTSYTHQNTPLSPLYMRQGTVLHAILIGIKLHLKLRPFLQFHISIAFAEAAQCFFLVSKYRFILGSAEPSFADMFMFRRLVDLWIIVINVKAPPVGTIAVHCMFCLLGGQGELSWYQG